MSSLRARLLLAGTILVAAFIAVAGASLEQAFRGAALQGQQDKMRGLVYALLGAAELSQNGSLVIASFDLPDPRLTQPQSGLEAWILDPEGDIVWRSPGTLTPAPAITLPEVGVFQFETRYRAEADDFLIAYGLNWLGIDAEARRFTLVVAEDTSGYKSQLAVFRGELWLYLVVTAAGLLAALALLLGWVVAPVRRMTRELHRIEAGAQAQLAKAYPRELAPLAEALNAMIRGERSQQARYRDALGDLAHSLKTPLAVLRGLLQEQPPRFDKMAEQLDRMQQISDHQLRRAATAGRRTLSEPVLLRTIAEKTTGALAKVYAGKGVKFAVELPPGLRLRADEGDLFELFGNLLDNAAKWSKGAVRLRAERSGAGVQLTFEDDGPGFPEDAEKLLVRGARADERMPGQGIGLSTVTDIVRAYEGKLELGRAALGGGSVRVWLPG